MKRNNIVVTMVKEEGVVVTLNSEFLENVITKVGVKNSLETQGNQAYFQGNWLIVLIWLLPNVNATRFSTEEEIDVRGGAKVIRVKPALQEQCTMTISGMPLCSPDSLVEEMVQLYGGKLLSPHGVMEKYRVGPFRGQFNGVRRYQVDMTSQVQPMGTSHLLDDTRIRVQYPGNQNTCETHHQFPTGCPGRVAEQETVSLMGVLG